MFLAELQLGLVHCLEKIGRSRHQCLILAQVRPALLLILPDESRDQAFIYSLLILVSLMLGIHGDVA